MFGFGRELVSPGLAVNTDVITPYLFDLLNKVPLFLPEMFKGCQTKFWIAFHLIIVFRH